MVPASATLPVREFLGRGPLGSFIAGEWRTSPSSNLFQTFDPGTGEVLAAVYEATPQDVGDAVDAATNAFVKSRWADLAPNERAVYLHRLADLVENPRSVIATLQSLSGG